MGLPERLGRLRRIKRIGAGGFATVWLYHDDELRSPVAVKALADNWAQRIDVRERFLEEARILRRAESDHVVRVYDIGEVDETPYFVMSYADQGTVADLIEEGRPLALERVVDLVTQAGIGLDVLHRHGVIHRDVKPQNLLLHSTPDGGSRVVVADLGVAKAMLHASGLTQVVGTPAYMAPEQAIGVGVDRRADVHALGAVAFHLITGRLIRAGAESLTVGERPIPPSQYLPLPIEVDRVLLRALDPDPAERWPEVVDFTAALRQSVAETVQPAIVSDQEQNDPAQNDPAQNDPAQNDPAQNDPAEGDPAQHQLAQRRRDWLSTARPRRVLLFAVVVLVLTFAGSFAVVSLFTS